MSRFQEERLQYIQRLYESYPKLFNYQYPDLLMIKAKGLNKIKATLPLKDHPLYGETVLLLSEKLSGDEVIEYHYAWELSQREGRMGKQRRHIMAFGNEPHPHGPAHVSTDPYHHHHVPQDPSKRKATNVTDLETVLGILEDYINGSIKYEQTHSFL